VSDLKIKNISGSAIARHGNDIDTDRIIPARFLKTGTFQGLGELVFFDDREHIKVAGGTHPFDEERRQAASILLVNKNFGCGSSREHAPQALHRWGIKAVVGESFGEIFFNNSIAVGLPCAIVDNSTIELLQSLALNNYELQFDVDLENKVINVEEKSYSFDMANGPRKQFLDGCWDATQLLMSARQEILDTANRLPYVTQW